MQLSCTDGVWKLRFKGISSQVGDRSSDRTVWRAGHATPTGGILGAPFSVSVGTAVSALFLPPQSHWVHSPGPSSQAPPQATWAPFPCQGQRKGPLEPALSFKGPGWSNVDELDVRCTKGGWCSEESIRSQWGLCPKGKAPPPG